MKNFPKEPSPKREAFFPYLIKKFKKIWEQQKTSPQTFLFFEKVGEKGVYGLIGLGILFFLYEKYYKVKNPSGSWVQDHIQLLHLFLSGGLLFGLGGIGFIMICFFKWFFGTPKD